MPSRPRSEKLFTGRSRAVLWTAPFTTLFTRPVFFSVTRTSFGPRKATPVGRSSPVATGRTPSRESVISGPGSWAEAERLNARIVLAEKAASRSARVVRSRKAIGPLLRCGTWAIRATAAEAAVSRETYGGRLPIGLARRGLAARTSGDEREPHGLRGVAELGAQPGQPGVRRRELEDVGLAA